MANYGITVDTGRRGWSRAEPLPFMNDTKAVKAALASMRGGVQALGVSIRGASRGLKRMGWASKGVVAALMDARSVVDGLQAGMRSLYAYSRTWWKTFAGTLSALAGNAAYLKNSLAAMGAPLVNALAPAIEGLTDRLVGLFNLVNQFFARLGGASTYVAAKRTAAGIDAVGSAASGATAQVKALKRQLADFDDLNVLSGSENDSGGSGGGGGGGAGDMFEERQIESGLAAFADSLRAAFEASDWMTLGTLIGEKINTLVDSVDWAALGRKVGFYVNGLFSTAYWTLETVNFTNIGASVAEFLNNALAEIDFTTVGATVALLFTSLAETIAGFVEEFDWVQFAEKLADGLNGFVAKLGQKLDAIDWGALALKLTEGLNTFIARTDWAKAGKTLAGRVNDLLEVLGTASANFDWKGAGAALATAVNNLFKSVDWEGLGDWLNDTLQGVLDFGIAFLQGFDAAGFANNVGKALARVDWGAVAEKLWTLFKAALTKLGEFVGTLLFGGSADVKLNLGLLKDGWNTIAQWLGIEDPMSVLISLLKDNWQTIAKWLGIEDPISALVNLIKGDPKTVEDVYKDKEKRVTGTTELKQGTEETNPKGKQTVEDVYKEKEKRVTGTTELEKGTEETNPKGKQTVEDVYDSKSKKVEGKTQMVKGDKGKQTAEALYSSKDKAINVKAGLSKGWSGTPQKALGVDNLRTDLEVNLKKGSNDTIEITQSGGGGGSGGTWRLAIKALGGVFLNGLWHSIPQYARGTLNAMHGSMFLAGEAGPELVGHVGGRTEVLNKSQIASAMYSAVVAGMGQAVSALGTFLSGQMANCTNAIVGSIGGLAAANIRYHAPVMATGTVLPYDVAAQIAKTGADIQGTLDANNEDLIQTIISVIGAQTSAIVAALKANPQQQGATAGALTAQQMIDDINRRAQMFGSSPLLD